MKTTAGKTKTKRRERVIRIFAREGRRDDRLIAVRSAETLKKALVDYFEEALKPHGYTKPQVSANVLTVTWKKREYTFIAKDVS